MTNSILLGLMLMICADWALLVGSGHNLSFIRKEEFTMWHGKWGRSMRVFGSWGVAVAAVFIFAGLLAQKA